MAFCSECGTDIGTAKFCSNCGASIASINTPSELPKNPPKEKQKEKDLAMFTDGFKCDIKLTTERIYAKSVGLEETYALRSVDGIGVYDDIDKFKNDKLKVKEKTTALKNKGIALTIYAVILGIGGFFLLTEGNGPIYAIIMLVCAAVCGYYGNEMFEKSKKMKADVKLDSYVKIIISGNNKLYLFNKKSKDAAKVAEFINKVEETLTKYD